jgi:hypothetical protein
MTKVASIQANNKAIARAAFERGRKGADGPFESPAPDTVWTIIGSAPSLKAYHSEREFYRLGDRPVQRTREESLE